MGNFPDDHYAKILFQINEQNTKSVEELLASIASVPNLDSKIAALRGDKSKEAWESLLGELEFCECIKQLSPEFVPQTSNVRTPDLKVSFKGQSIYFEVKSVTDLDYSGLVYSELSGLDSRYMVTIEHDFLSKDSARSLLDEIKTRITDGAIGKFSTAANTADYELSQKPIPIASQRTVVVMGFRDFVKVQYPPIRKKVFKDFYSKESQLSENACTFLVFATRSWRIEPCDIRDAVYGTITCIVGEENISQQHGRALDLQVSQLDTERRKLLNEIAIFPTKGAVNMFDGLFWNPDASCLSGVIAFEKGRVFAYPNPFVRKEVDVKLVCELCSKLSA
jgi:hypothetical protein